MANAQLIRAERQVRQTTNIDTIAAIIANDGTSPYSTTKGRIWVQIRQGASYLPRIEVENFLGGNPSAGVSVRLGYRNKKYGVVDVDNEAVRASGGNPDTTRLPANEANYTNAATIPILKAVPQSPPSTSLVVLPIWLERPTGLSQYAGEVVSLSSEISALSSGEQQLVGLFLTPADAVEKVTATAFSTTDPFTTSHIDECYAGRTPGAILIGFWKISNGQTDINSNSELLDARQFINTAPAILYSTLDISNPPTDAELDAEFGTPATVGAGFMAIINDNNGDAAEYLVHGNGTSWWYVALTKAV